MRGKRFDVDLTAGEDMRSSRGGPINLHHASLSLPSVVT
jgi:hypothetical protein